MYPIDDFYMPFVLSPVKARLCSYGDLKDMSIDEVLELNHYSSYISNIESEIQDYLQVKAEMQSQ